MAVFTDRVTTHEIKLPRKTVHPTLDGTSVSASHGYVHRKTVLLLWITGSDIADTITNHETSGYIREGQPRISYAINPQLELYNVDVTFVKYSSS